MLQILHCPEWGGIPSGHYISKKVEEVMPKWLGLVWSAKYSVFSSLSFPCHAVKDCKQPQLVVALRHMHSVAEETLYRASTLDTWDMLSFGSACLPSLHSSALKPALLSACLFTSSLVTLKPFPSSYPNCGSLDPGSNSCICWAATPGGPEMGLGIQCWAAGWCSGFLGQVSSFVPFVLLLFPLPHPFY